MHAGKKSVMAGDIGDALYMKEVFSRFLGDVAAVSHLRRPFSLPMATRFQPYPAPQPLPQTDQPPLPTMADLVAMQQHLFMLQNWASSMFAPMLLTPSVSSAAPSMPLFAVSGV